MFGYWKSDKNRNPVTGALIDVHSAPCLKGLKHSLGETIWKVDEIGGVLDFVTIGPLPAKAPCWHCWTRVLSAHVLAPGRHSRSIVSINHSGGSNRLIEIGQVTPSSKPKVGQYQPIVDSWAVSWVARMSNDQLAAHWWHQPAGLTLAPPGHILEPISSQPKHTEVKTHWKGPLCWMPWNYKGQSPIHITLARLWWAPVLSPTSASRPFRWVVRQLGALWCWNPGHIKERPTGGPKSLCTLNSCPNITKNFASHSSSLHPVGSRTSRYPMRVLYRWTKKTQ